MALDWNAFSIDDILQYPEEWSDASRTALLPQLTANMPPPSSSTPRGQVSKDLQNTSNFGLYEPSHLAVSDPYFSDAYLSIDDYFLNDLGVLEPFGNTIAGSTANSSREASAGATGTTPTDLQQESQALDTSSSSNNTPGSTGSMSPPVSAISHVASRDTDLYSNSPYTMQYSTRRDGSFIEDLTFPDGPAGAPKTTTSSMESPMQSVLTDSGTTTKRSKAEGRSDTLGACWTSPLCPNHGSAVPPNPSTCGGGCAPFLFATEEAMQPTLDQQLLMTSLSSEEPTGVVEVRPRLKRSESDSSVPQQQGRTFPKSATPTKQVKEESVQDSPEQVQASGAVDAAGKPRKRLPHNQVERKYRESLNTQLESLRKVVPSLQQAPRVCDGADIEDLPAPTKPSKAIILASATAYIKQMEKDKKQLHDENLLLRQRVKTLQSLVKCHDCTLMQYVVDLKINPNQT